MITCILLDDSVKILNSLINEHTRGKKKDVWNIVNVENSSNVSIHTNAWGPLN